MKTRVAVFLKNMRLAALLLDTQVDSSGLSLSPYVLAKDDNNATVHSHSIFHLINHGYIHLYQLTLSIGTTDV